MKLRYFIILVLALVSIDSSAQLTAEYPAFIPGGWSQGKTSPNTTNKSTPCGIDTLYYSWYNNSGPTQFLNLQPTRGGGMYFKIDDTVKLYGFNFFAYALQNGIFFGPQEVTCKVYYANANRLPAGIPLATKLHTINAINTTKGALRQKVLFDTPIQVVSDFVVTIEFNANLPNRIVLASNNYDSLDGFGNGYSCVKISNNWSNNLNVSGTPFDADFMFEPVVEYKMSANYDHGLNSCLGNGESFEFINTSTFATNPLFSKGMIDKSLDDDFIWEYGDGTPADTIFNAIHLFPGSSGYGVSLNGSFQTWVGSTCTDDTIIWLDKGNISARYSHTRNDKIIFFTNNSVDADRFEWDFGDGSAISTQADPIHVYSLYNVYNVTLRAWNRGCVDSVIHEIDVNDYTGVNDIENTGLSIDMSPNPASDVLRFTSNVNNNAEGLFEIYDMQGKILKDGTFNEKSSTSVSDLSKGIYFVKFNYGSQTLTKRLVIK